MKKVICLFTLMCHASIAQEECTCSDPEYPYCWSSDGNSYEGAYDGLCYKNAESSESDTTCTPGTNPCGPINQVHATEDSSDSSDVTPLANCSSIKTKYVTASCCGDEDTPEVEHAFNWYAPIETLLLLTGAKTEAFTPHTQCSSFQKGYRSRDCCESTPSLGPFCGKSVAISESHPICDLSPGKRIKEVDNGDYTLQFIGEPSGKGYLYLEPIRLHVVNGGKVMDYYDQYVHDCAHTWYDASCLDFSPNGKWNMANVYEYDWRSLLSYRRGVYSDETKSYHFPNGTSHWSTDIKEVFIYDDMTMGDSSEIWTGVWQASTSEGRFSDSKSRSSLFNPDGSLKPCNNFWETDGWGGTYYGSVAVTEEGVNELTFPSSRGSYRISSRLRSTNASLSYVEYVPKKWRFNSSARVYWDVQALPGFDMENSYSKITDICPREKLFQMYKPNGIAVHSYCDYTAPIVSGLTQEFGCLD